MAITTQEQVSLARKLVQDRADALGFGALERTKLVTAASEVARNVLVHGGGGEMTLTELNTAERIGIQLDFRDKGKGIPDIEQAMQDGFTTANSLGLGLGGARRLVNKFEIHSTVNSGTHVRLTQWKRR